MSRERSFSDTIYESKPYETKPIGLNGGTEVSPVECGDEKSTIVNKTGDDLIEPPSPPDVPPPLAPPPPLARTPPTSAPLPPLRWRSASLDSRVRSRVRLTTNLSKFEVEAISGRKSREDLSVAQPVESGYKIGAKKDPTTLPSCPPIAPPPSIEDIRARSASLDNRLFRRGKASSNKA